GDGVGTDSEFGPHSVPTPSPQTSSQAPAHHPDLSARSASHTSGTNRRTVHAASVPPAPTVTPPSSTQQPFGSVATRTNAEPPGGRRSSTRSRRGALPGGNVVCPAASPVMNSDPSFPQPTGCTGDFVLTSRESLPLAR